MKKLLPFILGLSLISPLSHSVGFAAEESPELYIAKVISDFAGKQIQKTCGEVKNGEYEYVNSISCQQAVIQIKQKIKPSLQDCRANLLSQDACVVIQKVSEALDKLTIQKV